LAKFAFGRLIDVVTEMNLQLSVSGVEHTCIHHAYKEVYLILPGSIAVCIKVSILPVGTGEDSKADFGNIVVLVRTSLGPAERAFVGAATDVELVIVLGKRGEIFRFNLLRVSSSLYRVVE
jgi:hypothetical protein